MLSKPINEPSPDSPQITPEAIAELSAGGFTSIIRNRPEGEGADQLKWRKPDLDIAIIDPADIHSYQPGWTTVGAGIFDPSTTTKTMASLTIYGKAMLKGREWMAKPEILA